MRTRKTKSNGADLHALKDYDGAAVASTLANWVNDMSSDEEFPAFGGQMAHAEHRTLIQKFWRMVKEFVHEAAENGDAGRFDARNKQTVEECQQVRDRLKSGPLAEYWRDTAYI
jgi:hypothetical protein